MDIKYFKIVSYHETTMDYPGRMALIVFTPGCNFRCKYCHNPELVFEEAKEIDMDVLLKNIKNRKEAGWYSGICISGGEPTIHKELVNFCQKLKETGIDIKLDTNGSNPLILRELIKRKLLDYIAMDIKSTRENYDYITNVKVDIKKIEESIKIVKDFLCYEFRTTVMPFMNEKDFESIGKWISENGRKKIKNFTLQQFSPKNTLDESFMILKPKTKEEIEKIALIMKKYSYSVRVLA